MALLQIDVVSRADGEWLCPRGELDMSTAAVLEQELRSAESREPALIVIDLRGLSFMDSTGLHILVETAARALAAGRRLALVRGRTQVMRVFEITRMEGRFEFVSNPAAVVGPPVRRAG